MARKLKCRIATSNSILSLYAIHEAVELMGRTGYDAIELWPERLELQVRKRETSIAKVKAALKKYNMTGVIHAPLRDIASDDKRKYNLCSKDAALRRKSIRKTLEAIDMAHKLGFNVITVHPGHTDKEGETADRRYWELQINAFRRLARHAERLGVRIGMEPMEHRPREFVMEPREVDRIIRAVKSKSLGITFDLIHAYSHGAEKPVEFLDRHHRNIFHVHVSGHSKDKNHVPFSMTTLRHAYLDKVLRHLVGLRGYKGIISIEGHTRGIVRQTRTHQRKVVKDNLEYIHRELKSLHLE